MTVPSARRGLSASTAALTAALLVLLLAAPASAGGPPQHDSGSGMITSLEITSQRDAGGNSIQERRIVAQVDGALRGTFVQETRGVVHRNGHVTFTGTLHFTGELTTCGQDGTLTARVSGRGQAGAAPVTDAAFRVVQQPANSISVTGTGTMHQVGPLFDYQVRVVCH